MFGISDPSCGERDRCIDSQERMHREEKAKATAHACVKPHAVDMVAKNFTVTIITIIPFARSVFSSVSIYM